MSLSCEKKERFEAAAKPTAGALDLRGQISYLSAAQQPVAEPQSAIDSDLIILLTSGADKICIRECT